MATEQTLLQLLQTRTVVHCDTMDVEVPKSLGPFVDCTSNQAIAFFELQKPVHVSTLQESCELAKRLSAGFPGVTATQLAVDIAMCKLQLGISRFVTGYVHVQTNPYFSYDTDNTIHNARRIVQIFEILDPKFDTSRVCIKIPTTWEGLQACRTLQQSGITTLATTLFTIEQASLAGEVGCHYIAPYVNELKVHFEEGFVDHNKAQKMCLQAQKLYEEHGIKTQVLPASLTSIAEIMALAGVHCITIAPGLLQELATTPASTNTTKSLFDETADSNESHPLISYFHDRGKYQIAFTRSGNGEGERKLSQAINIFCDMQDKLEAMLKCCRE